MAAAKMAAALFEVRSFERYKSEFERLVPDVVSALDACIDLDEDVAFMLVWMHPMRKPFERLTLLDKVSAVRYYMTHDDRFMHVPYGALCGNDNNDNPDFGRFRQHIKNVIEAKLCEVEEKVAENDSNNATALLAGLLGVCMTDERHSVSDGQYCMVGEEPSNFMALGRAVREFWNREGIYRVPLERVFDNLKRIAVDCARMPPDVIENILLAYMKDDAAYA